MKKQIYMDYAASTPVDLPVVKAMLPYFNKYHGNASSLHNFGVKSAAVLQESREIIAHMIGARPQEIIFTSSATESNNMALKGVAFANREKGKHILVSAIEHDCVLASAAWLKKQGFEIEKIPVNKYGLVDPGDVEKRLRPDTILVSVMHANNEMGAIEPIEKIGKLCRKRNIYFHTDAAQSFGKIPIDVDKMNIDLLTASSQKIYGPKGAALLFVRKGTKIDPLLHGGGHEFGLRSGTANIPAIVGFAKAAEICMAEMAKENLRLTELRDDLTKKLLAEIPKSHLNGHPTKRLANNINIRFDGIEGESILMLLNAGGVAGATGSACSSKNLQPSHVLIAMGIEPEKVHGSLRLSLGRWTTKEDIEHVVKILPKIIARLRAISPID
ncbi:MAG: cysteine desulfurase family protein [Patescibacteria group bacterium]